MLTKLARILVEILSYTGWTGRGPPDASREEQRELT
jgi:hypothetical protein